MVPHIYIYICKYIHMCIHIYTHIRAYVYKYIRIHVYIYMCRHIRIYGYLYICIYVYKCIRICVYIYTHMYACMYVYIHLYVYTCICTECKVATPGMEDKSLKKPFMLFLCAAFELQLVNPPMCNQSTTSISSLETRYEEGNPCLQESVWLGCNTVGMWVLRWT